MKKKKIKTRRTQSHQYLLIFSLFMTGKTRYDYFKWLSNRCEVIFIYPFSPPQKIVGGIDEFVQACIIIHYMSLLYTVGGILFNSYMLSYCHSISNSHKLLHYFHVNIIEIESPRQSIIKTKVMLIKHCIYFFLCWRNATQNSILITDDCYPDYIII